MPTQPDIQPARDLGLWMNPRLWITPPNTDLDDPNCRYPVLGTHPM